jgi:protein subunit release factor A
MKIDPKDLAITTFSLGYPTSQTSVRVRHLPTGISVDCNTESSQYKNREIALEMLSKKLKEKLQEGFEG